MNEVITDIAVIVAASPAVVFADPQKAEALFAHIEREIAESVPNVTTAKGRGEIKSLAYKVAQTKTAIDAAGAELNEEANKKINAVNAERRKFKVRLEELQHRARKPLTDWEEAESLRKQKMDDILNRIGFAMIVMAADSSEAIAAKLAEVEAEELTAEVFQDKLEEAQGHKAGAIRSLTASLERARQAEADRAELDRLRAEQAERDRVAAVEAAAKHAEEARIAREREEEAQRLRAAEAEKARIAQATENARLQAEREAADAREKIEREHAEALAKAEREKNEAIEEAARKERERQAEAQRVAAEEAARAADREHRSKVMGEASAAIVEATRIGKGTADKVVLAILAGQVPHVTLRF
ncbi:MAG: hypothetical protein P4M09_17110 [Devosia sp.]|nr:hypothetical protein [Devosia sp.]